MIKGCALALVLGHGHPPRGGTVIAVIRERASGKDGAM